MDTIEHFRHLFDYNYWANSRIIFALKSSPSEKSLKILAHLLITEREYFERLYGKDSTGFDFWQELSREDCKNLALENDENFRHLLKRFDDEGLGLTVSYKTSAGIAYKNTYREMLTHILFHSSIHRGNIILKLREEDFSPPAIDYIIFIRN
jgi:uncharacterized damage-inducible protein DinB